MQIYNKESFIQFIKFGLVGLINTAISYGVYSVLVFLQFPYLIASVAGFILSVLNSFILNNKYVFIKKESEIRNLWKALVKTFFAYASTGLILSNILLIILIEILSVNEYIAPLVGLVITVPLNFIINKFWSFKPQKEYSFNEKN